MKVLFIDSEQGYLRMMYSRFSMFYDVSTAGTIEAVDSFSAYDVIVAAHSINDDNSIDAYRAAITDGFRGKFIVHSILPRISLMKAFLDSDIYDFEIVEKGRTDLLSSVLEDREALLTGAV